MKSTSSEAYFNRLAKSGYQPLLHRVSGTLRFNIDQKGGDVRSWYVRIDHGNLEISRVDQKRDAGGFGPAADCVLSGSESEFARILAGKDAFAAAFVRGSVVVEGDYTLAQNIRRFSPPADLGSHSSTPRHAPTDERATGRQRQAPGAKSTRRVSPHTPQHLEHSEQSESESWPTTKP